MFYNYRTKYCAQLLLEYVKKEITSILYSDDKKRIILRHKSRITEYFFHNQEEIYTQLWEQTFSLEKENLRIKIHLEQEKIYTQNALQNQRKNSFEPEKTKNQQKIQLSQNEKKFHFAHKTFLKKMFLMA